MAYIVNKHNRLTGGLYYWQTDLLVVCIVDKHDRLTGGLYCQQTW